MFPHEVFQRGFHTGYGFKALFPLGRSDRIAERIRGQVDEFFINSGNKIKKLNEKRNDKNIQKIVENSIKGVNPFIEYLNKVSIIYNEPIEILMDNNNLYLIEGEN